MNHSSINWPNALSEKVFKQEYWQQKPVLLRNLFSKDIAKNPVTQSEILKLSKTDYVPQNVYIRKSFAYEKWALTHFLKKSSITGLY